jgi:acetyltransferase-like isoleucine patch superfamily enzyme
MNTDKIVKLLRYVLALPKSIYVNLRLLPLGQAVKLPIIVSNKTKLVSLRGKVNLSKVKTAIVRIGFTGADMIDYRYHRSILQIDGEVNIEGKVKIGKGSRLIVTGKLSLGENLITTGDNTIICEKEMIIGDNCMFAWESIVMDTDQHQIFDADDNQINKDIKVTIGSNVWLGARCFVLKNSTIADGCIIAANTTLTRSFDQPSTIIAGTPPKVVKTGIKWSH